MRATRWLIEGWESKETATNWYRNTFPNYRLGNIRVVGREVEVSEKDVVKVLSRNIGMEIAGITWHRIEEGVTIEWVRPDTNTENGVTYHTHDGKQWTVEPHDTCNVVKCEEPEVERIWREYNSDT